MQRTSFRDATNQDGPAIQSLVFSILREYGLRPDPAFTDADLDRVEEFYVQNAGHFEVCTIEGNIVGTWGILPLQKGRCELRKMYLSRSARGLGLGKQMLERAIAWARSKGFTHIELETASILKEAINLYQAYGFTPLKESPKVSRCDLTMELAL